jgi:hypothetical protein
VSPTTINKKRAMDIIIQEYKNQKGINKQTNLQGEDKGQIISTQMFLCKRCHISQEILFKRKHPLSMQLETARVGTSCAIQFKCKK